MTRNAARTGCCLGERENFPNPLPGLDQQGRGAVSQDNILFSLQDFGPWRKHGLLGAKNLSWLKCHKRSKNQAACFDSNLRETGNPYNQDQNSLKGGTVAGGS